MKRTMKTFASVIALGALIAGCSDRETRVDVPPPPPPVTTAPTTETERTTTTTTTVVPDTAPGTTAGPGMTGTQPGSTMPPDMATAPGAGAPPGPMAGTGPSPGAPMTTPPGAPAPGVTTGTTADTTAGTTGAYGSSTATAPGATTDTTAAARAGAGLSAGEAREVQEIRQQLTSLRSRVEDLERKYNITPSAGLGGTVATGTTASPGALGATGTGASVSNDMRMLRQEIDNLRQRLAEVERKQSMAGGPMGGTVTK
jgi:hypothetical protein